MIRSLLLAASLALPLASASAAPTVQVFGGQTSVRLSHEFLGALEALEASADPIRPARARGTRVSFPIPGGGIDAGQNRGDVFHLGGLTIAAHDTEVDLLNFIIDLTGDPVLTGLVSVNGDLVDRVPLFDLELTRAPEVKRWGILVVRGVKVTLNAVAADALNEIFGLDDFFQEGFPIGEAKLVTRIVDTDRHPDEDDD